MNFRVRCPHCRGTVAALLRGFGQQYAGRQRYCRACGKIWRLHPLGYRVVVGVAVTLLVIGAALPYFLFEVPRADRWCVAWLVAGPAVGWPSIYYLWWKWKVRR